MKKTWQKGGEGDQLRFGVLIVYAILTKKNFLVYLALKYIIILLLCVRNTIRGRTNLVSFEWSNLHLPHAASCHLHLTMLYSMSPSLLSHLQYITSQPPSCTLVTWDQEQVEVQSHLLSLLSPLLASLLTQVGDCPYLSIPCTAIQIRKLLNSIVNGENVGREDSTLANVLGMKNSFFEEPSVLLENPYEFVIDNTTDMSMEEKEEVAVHVEESQEEVDNIKDTKEKDIKKGKKKMGTSLKCTELVCSNCASKFVTKGWTN